ncbi:ATP phosphoribosyltransferase regulatory subunit [hydrothermal vent metagenome]|uniref:ATP phosphoribosyltransferase regulatory subunit n=1 Tax=hydrothermal vent metagenome TaxID=652676 RepID=A0A3B1ARC4_9ZZZZ
MPRPVDEPNETALLPEGLHDTLANDAEYQADIVEKLRQCFASYGYERVVPPLLEFEESLLCGPGKAQSRNMFRVMDPVSMRLMAVRNDMTGQVARIARTRLQNSPRPLRLSYSGSVLRVRGSQLRPEREFQQAGIELIGSDSGEAYVEIILLARDVLGTVGIKNASIDLTMPLLVPAICRGLGLDDKISKAVRHALNAKDIGELGNLDGDIGEISRQLLSACGAADKAMAIIGKLSLPTEAQEICNELKEILARLKDVAPELDVTVDPGEYSGFEFQTGIGFSLFVKGVRGELGRGGRYLVEGGGTGSELKSEPATGFSLYLDSLMRAVPMMTEIKYIYCPYNMTMSDVNKVRLEGYRTICGLEAAKNDTAEAKRLNCQYIWQDDKVIKI